MREEILRLRTEAEKALREAEDHQSLEAVRIRYLGKRGELTQLLRQLGSLDPQDRPVIGSLVNEARDALEKSLQERRRALDEAALEARLQQEAVDVTLPGRGPLRGRLHPVTQVIQEVQRVAVGLGFRVAEGPEIETDYYNFEALNVPPDHPARDMQDTFYVKGGYLLRTQTSPVQIRVMEAQEPPIRIIAPGRVYRVDADVTHSPMFHQIEGLYVDRRVTFADLKGTLATLARELFGRDRAVRFRPSYFPFTEPSAEMDIQCIICNGEGCRSCGYEGWLEILGSGMVHPRVLEYGGFDPKVYSGFAFGLGVDRIAITKYGIDDIRHFYTSDVRFLRQFARM